MSHSQRGDRGYAIVLTALLLVPLLAAASVAIDLGSRYAEAAKIQRAADAAALAGVTLLPQGFPTAEAEAWQVAERNGYKNGVNGVTVTVTLLTAEKLQVTVKNPKVPQYFGGLFSGTPSIERRATARYVRAVPMGSPRNYLGTANCNPACTGADKAAAGIPLGYQENFYLSASGYCARKEHGDRITTFSDSNGGSSFESCIPGSTTTGISSVFQNPDYRASGYIFAVEFKQDYAGTANIQIFDAPHCESAGTKAGDDAAGDTGNSAQRKYKFTLRDSNNANPLLATELLTRTLGPADCPTWSTGWNTLFDLPINAKKGIYFLQIQPLAPPAQTGAAGQEGQNQFSLRIADNGTFTPCSSDPTEPPYIANRVCPNVYALTHLGVKANLPAGTPSFYLASIEQAHGGKTLEVELFDAADGAQKIELLDPAGNPFPFKWEVACQDASYRSENNNACRTATQEAGPTGGYGPPAGTVMSLDVSGSGTKPWGARNEQDGKYSDRTIRLSVKLPTAAQMATAYGNRTWWKIRYTVGTSTNDRTTWSVSVKGDPVRLLPNL